MSVKQLLAASAITLMGAPATAPYGQAGIAIALSQTAAGIELAPGSDTWSLWGCWGGHPDD
jgi:hypothetical protein